MTYNGDGDASGIYTGTVGACIPNHRHCNYKRPVVPDSELKSAVEDFGLIIGDRIGEAYSEDACFGPTSSEILISRFSDFVTADAIS